MMKKLTASLGALVLSVSFLMPTVSAETFTYTMTIEQPALAVSIVSTATTYDIQTIVDRTNPVINLDTYITENTGNVDAFIEAKAKLTGKNGSTAPSLMASGISISKVTSAMLILKDEATQMPFTSYYIDTIARRFYDIAQTEIKRTVLDLKVHPDFSATMDIEVEFTAKPI